jgi:hypothetical protein
LVGKNWEAGVLPLNYSRSDFIILAAACQLALRTLNFELTIKEKDPNKRAGRDICKPTPRGVSAVWPRPAGSVLKQIVARDYDSLPEF